MVRWSQEDQIQDPELVRIMYSLLRRQYDSIGELLQALRKAYTISAASVKDTINLLAALGQIRSLLSVRMGKEEELLMINGLGYGINRILFLSWCEALFIYFIPFITEENQDPLGESGSPGGLEHISACQGKWRVEVPVRWHFMGQMLSSFYLPKLSCWLLSLLPAAAPKELFSV